MPSPATTAEPAPIPNHRPAVWDLVIADMHARIAERSRVIRFPTDAKRSIFHRLEADMVERDALGAERYGVRLQPFNGRDALADCYQEVLDGIVYARQALIDGDLDADLHGLVDEEVYREMVGVAGMLRGVLTYRDERKARAASASASAATLPTVEAAP